MFTIEINGTSYPLKFGLGFMRDINKKYAERAKEAGFQRDDAGLMVATLSMLGDKSVVALIDIIMSAAKSVKDNQLKESELVEWIEDENTDIDGLFKDVESFFEKANFCKNTLTSARNNIKLIDAEMKAEVQSLTEA